MLEYADRTPTSRDALPTFFAHSPDATLLIEPCLDGVSWAIVDINIAACTVYRYTRDELVGQRVALLDSVDAESTTDALVGSVERDGPLRVETVHRRADGTRLDVELSLTPLPDTDRTPIVAVIRDIAAQKGIERRLVAQHAISQLLAGAGHFMDIVPRMLQIIGEQLDWALGALWCVQGDSNALRCTATWRAPDTHLGGFEAACQAITLDRGAGLPGEVWERGAPVWLADVGTARNFSRHAIAAQAGLLSAFAFPIMGPSSGIFGVMEFFSRETRSPDAGLLGMATAIGTATGEYIERRRAETALRASEARKGAILQAARDAIITIDDAGTISEFNPAAELMFGYRQDEAVGHALAGLIIPPALGEPDRAGMARYLATGEDTIMGQRVELPALRADGTEFPVELTITRIPTDGPPAFTAFVRDITERKRAEVQQQFLVEASTLLAASLDYDATLTSLADLIVPGIADWCSVNLRDADGTLVRVVGRHVDPVKEAVLHALREQHPPDLSRPSLWPPVFPVNRGTLVAEVTYAHLEQFAQNAEQLNVYRAMGFRSAMFVPLHLNSRLLGIMILATGESGRHYSAEDLALAEDLARRAALAIENARLYQEAQTAIQVRDTFLSIAAHELKTPVTAIMGYAQVLQRRARQGDDQRSGRAAQVIAEQSERLSKLVGSLLEASRLETGQFTLDCQPLDLCALVRRVAEEVALTLPVDSMHSLTCRCAEETLILAGDALRLEQVFHNLLQNAIKYSPQGGPISVRVARDADQAIIALSDQGMGIPSDAQANVFQRFYRAGNVRNDHISGMGIGLYVVKEIVSRHGGTVDVASVEGTGSTFTVHLPVACDGYHSHSVKALVDRPR